jgi:hypothetical protein
MLVRYQAVYAAGVVALVVSCTRFRRSGVVPAQDLQPLDSS